MLANLNNTSSRYLPMNMIFSLNGNSKIKSSQRGESPARFLYWEVFRWQFNYNLTNYK